MPIDYRLATKVIDYAMKGIDSLISKNYRPPTFAFSVPGSSREAGPNPELYRKRVELPSIDARVRAYYSTPEPITNIPSAREVLYRLLNF